jgi:UDP-2,4-diacetamido-2,4,6-trideoxy-beta-L-altropyranose hydrolase
MKKEIDLFIRVEANQVIGAGHLQRIANILNHMPKSVRLHMIISLSDMAKNIINLNIHSHIFIYDISKGADFSRFMLGRKSSEDALAFIKYLEKSQSNNIYVIADNYGIDEQWISMVRNHCEKLSVIDDYRNRYLPADVVIDPTPGVTLSSYRSLVSRHSKVLAGKNYNLIPEHYFDSFSWKGSRKSLLISFGGGRYAETFFRQVDLSFIAKELDINILSDPFKTKIECNFLGFVGGYNDVATSYKYHIGALGQSSIERIAMRIPSINIVIEDNQKYIYNFFNAQFPDVTFRPNDISKEKIITAFEQINSDIWYEKFLEKSRQLYSGTGIPLVVNSIID